MIKKKPGVCYTSNTLLYCLLGKPIKHSLSPVMHNALFKYFDYNGVYLAFKVEDIRLAIAALRALNIKGCSITIPYKISVIDSLDYMDTSAKQISAVNTIRNDNGILIGYNFDCLGAMKALADVTDIVGKTIVLLGSGGAGRAIGYGIKKNGGNLKIFNRTKKKAEKLAFELNADFCNLSDLFELKADIIINTIPVGTVPAFEYLPIPEEILKPNMVVMDIVYNPIETMLLKKAKKKGCKTINGLTMLAYQGALQFECWTKIKPPLNFIKKILINCLA